MKKQINQGKRYEFQEQIVIFQWADLYKCVFPQLKLLFHVPNGGYRDKKTAAGLKRQGVKKGVPDICLPVAKGNYHGLFIELKVDGKKPSEVQCEWISALSQEGFKAVSCNGAEEAICTIINYLKKGI